MNAANGIDSIKEKDSAAAPTIIGIGASAGGLEALQQFFACMPANSGLSFVVVQHLSPDYKSFMADILGKHTDMRVLGGHSRDRDKRKRDKIHAENIVQHTMESKTGFREEQLHGAVHQRRMDQPARGGRREDPGQGMFPPFGPIKHSAGNQSEQGAGTDAQKNTFQRTFAHGGGKHRVSGPHIEGRGFPHGRQAKHCSHGRSLLGPQHTAGH